MPNLEEWMIEKDKSIAELAELFRLSTKSIRAYLYKGAMPGRDAMHKIYNATGKEVDANSFHGFTGDYFEEYKLGIEYTEDDIDMTGFTVIDVPKEYKAREEFSEKLPKLLINRAKKECLFIRAPFPKINRVAAIPLKLDWLSETMQAAIKEEKDGMVIHPATNEYEWIRHSFAYAKMNAQKFNEHIKDFRAGKFRKLPKLQNHQKPRELMKAKLSH